MEIQLRYLGRLSRQNWPRMSSDIIAAARPGLNAPSSNSVCQISIINTTCDIVVPTDSAVEPLISGYKWLNLPTYSFYIKNEHLGREVLFDLGMRKDWQNSVPHIRDTVAAQVNGLNIKMDVPEILSEGTVDLNNIEAFIMSHWHWDHCGAPEALPKSVKVIVGPGFRDAFLPGWPTNANSPFHEADFDGREVIEAPFSEGFKIGQFQAYDYFGDGSLYVLDVPGHAIGHVGALVRTTPETFVFLGGDVCHSNGAIRPTQYIPMPDPIPAVTAFTNRLIASPCPCAAFSTCHPDQEHSRTVRITRMKPYDAGSALTFSLFRVLFLKLPPLQPHSSLIHLSHRSLSLPLPSLTQIQMCWSPSRMIRLPSWSLTSSRMAL